MLRWFWPRLRGQILGRIPHRTKAHPRRRPRPPLLSRLLRLRPQRGPIKLGDVTVTGSLRSRLYVWNWFQPPTGENQYEYSGNLLRLNFAEKLAQMGLGCRILPFPFLLGLPTGATDPAPQGALGLGSNYYSANHGAATRRDDLPQAALCSLHVPGGVKGRRCRSGASVLGWQRDRRPKDATLATLKRDRVSQRLLGDFGLSDVGRSFDGVHYSYSRPLTTSRSLPLIPTRGVFQTDGWGWNRVGFGYAAYTHEWGKGRHSADTRFFALEYDDWRHILKTDNRPTAIRKTAIRRTFVINTVGGHSLHALTTGAGTLDALAWGAVQTGRWGTQQQLSYAFDFEGGFQPKILPRVKPWLRGGFTMGSGDENPNDNTHGTFFQVLPTPRPYARFPFFNMMNTQDSFGSLILRPHSKITVSSEFHSLRPEQRRRSLVQRRRRLINPGRSAIRAGPLPAAGRWGTCMTPASNIERLTEDHVDRLSGLHAGPGRDGVDLPAGQGRTVRVPRVFVSLLRP